MLNLSYVEVSIFVNSRVREGLGAAEISALASEQFETPFSEKEVESYIEDIKSGECIKRIVKIEHERRKDGEGKVYDEISKLVKDAFGKEVTRNFIYYHAVKKERKERTPADKEDGEQGSVSVDTVEELILELRARKMGYSVVASRIKEQFPDEKRELRNLIYKVWSKRKKEQMADKQEKAPQSAALARCQEPSLSASPSRKTLPLEADTQESECPCGGAHLVITDEARGEEICSRCGTVVTERAIDLGPEWRYFDLGDKNKIRTGTPITFSLFDKGLSTDIQLGKDGRGQPLKAKQRQDFMRWRKAHARNRISSSDNRNLCKAFNELDKICSQLDLPKSYKEEIAILYRKMRKSELVNGTSINGMITACVFAVCKLHKRGITQQDMLEYAPVKNVKELRMCLKRLSDLGITLPTSRPRDYLPRFASDLGLPEYISTKALVLLDACQKYGLSVSKNPLGMVAAVLYLISDMNGIRKTQKEFSETCQVTEVTIRQRCAEITDFFKLQS